MEADPFSEDSGCLVHAKATNLQSSKKSKRRKLNRNKRPVTAQNAGSKYGARINAFNNSAEYLPNTDLITKNYNGLLSIKVKNHKRSYQNITSSDSISKQSPLGAWQPSHDVTGLKSNKSKHKKKMSTTAAGRCDFPNLLKKSSNRFSKLKSNEEVNAFESELKNVANIEGKNDSSLRSNKVKKLKRAHSSDKNFTNLSHSTSTCSSCQENTSQSCITNKCVVNKITVKTKEKKKKKKKNMSDTRNSSKNSIRSEPFVFRLASNDPKEERLCDTSPVSEGKVTLLTPTQSSRTTVMQFMKPILNQLDKMTAYPSNHMQTGHNNSAVHCIQASSLRKISSPHDSVSADVVYCKYISGHKCSSARVEGLVPACCYKLEVGGWKHVTAAGSNSLNFRDIQCKQDQMKIARTSRSHEAARNTSNTSAHKTNDSLEVNIITF